MTADQLLHIREDSFRCELVRGELRKFPFADHVHGRTTMNAFSRLYSHVQSQGLGAVSGPGTGFQLQSDPDTVRAPDISFVKQSRLDGLGVVEGYFPGAPDLAVEVNSIFDTDSDVQEKVRDLLEAGTRMVIVVNPRKMDLTVYRSLTDITVLTENEMLDGGDMVPGWSICVRDIFE